MTRTRHVFDQSAPALAYMALGDTAVRCVAIRHLIDTFKLDAVVIPHGSKSLRGLWESVFGDLIADEIPSTHSDASVSRPTRKDWEYGAAAFNVFESVCWECGFFNTSKMVIAPPVVFRCDPSAKSVMLYPKEKTDGNRIYNHARYHQYEQLLRSKGWKINVLGDSLGIKPDAVFEPSIDGLKKCIAASSLAIGSSTGPTWACLLSDIPQIVLESKRSPHGYWNFDRCQRVLGKNLTIVQEFDAVI